MAADSSPIGVQNLKSAIELGQQILKSLELVNGGAVVAILTFYGNVVKDGSKVPIDPLWLAAALKTFAWGLAVALGAAACAYLGQLAVATNQPDDWITDDAKRRAYTERANKLSIGLLAAAVAAALISLGLFGGGVWCSTNALSTPQAAASTPVDGTSSVAAPAKPQAPQVRTSESRPKPAAPQGQSPAAVGSRGSGG